MNYSMSLHVLQKGSAKVADNESFISSATSYQVQVDARF